MKIEIAESMVYSWLRKVRNCQIVQTNWKPAPEWERSNDSELQRLMRDAETYFAGILNNSIGDNETDATTTTDDSDDRITDTSASTSHIFKKTAGIEQLIAQTECDVLGLNVQDSKFKAIAVEVAFHENGLNYSGGRKVTAKKIVSKFLRIIFALRTFFGVEEAELIFASPHVKNATLQQVGQMMGELNNFLTKSNLSGFSVSVFFNETFYSEIMTPLIESMRNHGAADTTELFIRALKLVELENNMPRGRVTLSTQTKKPHTSQTLPIPHNTSNSSIMHHKSPYIVRCKKAQRKERCWHNVNIAKLNEAASRNSYYTFLYTIDDKSFKYDYPAGKLMEIFKHKEVRIKDNDKWDFYGDYKTGKLYKNLNDASSAFIVQLNIAD